MNKLCRKQEVQAGRTKPEKQGHKRTEGLRTGINRGKTGDGGTEKLKAEAEERGWTGQRAKASEGNGGGGRGRVVDGRGRVVDRRGRAGTGGDGGGDGDGGGQRWAVEAEKTRNARYKKDRGIASAVFCRLLSVRQGRPPGYYPIRRAAPQGFRPEPVPESRPGASWRAPRSQGHAPEVPWRPSKFRCCSLRRAPCPWRA